MRKNSQHAPHDGANRESIRMTTSVEQRRAERRWALAAGMGGLRVAQGISVALVVAMMNLTILPLMPSAAWAQAAEGDAAAATASKAGRKMVVVIVGRKDADGEAATVLQSLFRQSVDKLAGIELAALAAARGGEKIKPAAAGAQRGEELLNSDPALVPDYGAQALNEFQQAAGLLQGAPGHGDVRLRAWVQKGIGVAAVLTGDFQLANTAIRRSLLLYPNQTAAEYGYSPGVTQFFESTFREMATESAGSIDVTTEPPGAEVVVGGTLKGYSPLKLDNLPVGEHYVVIAKDGYYRVATFVDVQSQAATPHEVVLQAAPSLGAVEANVGKVKRRLSKKASVPVLADLGAAAGATDVLVARTTLNKSGVFEVDGYYGGPGGESTPVSVELARDAQFLTNIESFLSALTGAEVAPEAGAGPLSAPIPKGPVEIPTDPDLVIDPDSPLFKKAGEEEERITDQWWFWTAIGAGAVAVALAIALPLALTEEEKGGGPTGNLTIDLGGIQ